MTLTAALGAGDDPAAVLAALAAQARAHVLDELRRSPSDAVRRALETPAEREAREQRERAEWEARNPHCANCGGRSFSGGQLCRTCSRNLGGGVAAAGGEDDEPDQDDQDDDEGEQDLDPRAPVSIPCRG